MLPIGPEERRFALSLPARPPGIPGTRHGLTVSDSAPCLLEHRGSFVTLRCRATSELRGCRGECRPNRPLIESVIRQVICSAIDDSRFCSVTEAELPRLTIRISALSALYPIRPEKIVLGRHGLLIVQGLRSGCCCRRCRFGSA